ncbi:hypothetical protein DKX38_029146 [Salix brachista]|uniref:EF-hand domain-containing protein n=1 Tax=Salix brachista TaxID=2182728 RepID=A0A5N5IYE8_9ROSI|nr:hypothetical protein DKX38_029146 [Salix brachista]
MEEIRRAAGAVLEHLFAKDKKLARKKFKAMEEIRRVAEAYYEHLPAKDKKLLRKTFNAMDENRDGKISQSEYMKYFKKEKAEGFIHQSIFSAMGKDDNGSLNFEEAKVLLYIMESGRAVICMACEKFMAGAYFSCSQCFFDGAKSKFDICCDCYGGNKFKHHRGATFCDNYTLLSESRSSAIAAPAEKRRDVLGTIDKIVGVASIAVAAGCIIM